MPIKVIEGYSTSGSVFSPPILIHLIKPGRVLDTLRAGYVILRYKTITFEKKCIGYLRSNQSRQPE